MPKPPANPLQPLANPAVVDPTHSTLMVVWENPNNSADYITVERSAAQGGPFTVVATLAGDEQFFHDQELPEQTAFFYRMTVVREADSSQHTTAVVSGTTEEFSPPSGVAPYLKLWLKADALELSHQDPVAVWPDLSSNGNDMEQVDSGKRPVFIAGFANGRPAVYFNGQKALYADPLSDGLTCTMIVVLKFDSAGSVTETPFKNGNSYGFGLLKTNQGKREVLLRGSADCVNGDATTDLEIWASTTNDTPYTALSVNGVGKTLDRTDDTPMAADSASHLGEFQAGTYPFSGHILEVFYYDVALSQESVNEHVGYLKRKYGIS